MKKILLSLSLGVLASMASAAAVQAATPGTIAVEGALLASGGTPAADGFYDVTFAIYADAVGGNPLWLEGPVKIATKGGQWTYVLGTTKAVTASALSGTQAYLGMQIASDPELPRKALNSVAFSVRSAVAEAVECSGCIGSAQIDAKVMADIGKTIDLSPYAKTASLAKVATTGNYADLAGGPDLSVYAKAADLGAYAKSAGLAKVATTGAYADLSGTPDLSPYVKAAALAKVAGTGSYADLASLPTLPQLGKSCGSGLVMSGIKADGSYECSASAIAPDLIDEISNGLIWDQFTDSASGPAALAIKDGFPAGTDSSLTFPDIGQAQKIWVDVNIANNDVSKLQILLYAPGIADPYTVYDKTSTGKTLKTTFNTTTPIAGGQFDKDWVGKNLKGTWTMLVKDLADDVPATTDGTVDWTLNIQTLSNQKIQIKGSLIVDKDLTTSGGNLNLGASGSITGLKAPKMPTYRYAFFNTYVEAAEGWMRGNDSFYFGGVAPSNWTDGNYTAQNLTSDKEQLRTLFTNKGYAGKNALLWSEVYLMYSSTNSRVFLSLWRVRNNTAADIVWPVYWTYTAYTGWGENASIALNGSNVWNSPCNSQSVCDAGPINITIPKGRVSTVIFQSTGSQPYSWGYNLQLRKIFQGFYNNCLALPAGLEYVDDFDTAGGGWEQ